MRIEGETLSLIAEAGENEDVYLTYWGRTAHFEMAVAPGFSRLPASPDDPVGPCLTPMPGRGFHGISVIEAVDLKSRRAVLLGKRQLCVSNNSLTITAKDPIMRLTLRQTLRFECDVLISQTHLEHAGTHPIDIQRLASALIPTPDWASEGLTHSGHWGREGYAERREWQTGRIDQLGRGGRPGFDGGPTLTLVEPATSEIAGRALSAHLAWSGPFCLSAERHSDGRGQLLAETLLRPGECVLEPGDTLTTPETWLALSYTGLNGVSERFHALVRQRSKPVERKVHFNTWEGQYFDVDQASCMALAKAAANLGAERFILDDGWFTGRRDDTTSLGDWIPDSQRFPNGLRPLVEAVQAEGMSFGLWLEPEMVSEKSQLFNNHSDWILGFPDETLPGGRNQLVLDLALSEVREYLFAVISKILSENAVDYIKWDCNRDLYPATRDGIWRAIAQTDGLYDLLGRLTEAFPEVEFESCASGGGRIDGGITPYVTRFWTSDATDALDRIRIQRAASLVMPPEMLGAHVGPSPNPMTGRSLPMALRVLTAMFGHFGIEADPAKLSDDDRAVLTRGIALYKRHRDWMGTARLVRHDGVDPEISLLMANDGSKALVRILRRETAKRPVMPRLRLAGLGPESRYSVTEIVLVGEPEDWPLGSFSGAGLMQVGLDLDPMRPQTGRIFLLERQSS